MSGAQAGSAYPPFPYPLIRDRGKVVRHGSVGTQVAKRAVGRHARTSGLSGRQMAVLDVMYDYTVSWFKYADRVPSVHTLALAAGFPKSDSGLREYRRTIRKLHDLELVAWEPARGRGHNCMGLPLWAVELGLMHEVERLGRDALEPSDGALLVWLESGQGWRSSQPPLMAAVTNHGDGSGPVKDVSALFLDLEAMDHAAG